MASVNIQIFPEEKDSIIRVLKKHKGKTMSVAAIAREAGLNPNRSRFIIEELLEEGRITRTATKQFNARYIRYCYDVVK